MTTADIWATIIGGAGLAVATLSLILAAVAQSKAKRATEAATKAGERAADALEQANELTLKLNAPRPAPWTLTFIEDHPQGNQWRLENRTGHVANQVYLMSPGGEFHETPATWDQVTPGSQIQVQAVRSFTDATVVVRWASADSLGEERLPITVHSPYAP